jgi:hypothetical protein
MAARGTAIQIRMPVIPGCNDDPANLEATADCCRSLGPALTLVQLLPYHRLGMPKYERVGKVYTPATVVPPTRETMQGYKALFESRGLPVRIGVAGITAGSRACHRARASAGQPPRPSRKGPGDTRGRLRPTWWCRQGDHRSR